ncbi:hemerythrin domain-containing protein [Modestobacter sp. SYSU DS0511]
MRSIAGQSVDELGGPGSVLVRLRREHEVLEDMLQRLPETSGDEQDELLMRLWRLVNPHAYGEELVLWPAVRRIADDGHEVTREVEQGEQELNELAAALERTGQEDPRRDHLISEVIKNLRNDVRLEEDVVLPRLQAAATPRQLRRLGLAWEWVRRTAPTRPHPTTSRRPPGNILSGLLLTVLDRSRDRLDRTARHHTGRAASTSRTASRVLAHAAGRVERVRALQRGEDPSTRPGRIEDERSP